MSDKYCNQGHVVKGTICSRDNLTVLPSLAELQEAEALKEAERATKREAKEAVAKPKKVVKKPTK